MYCNAKYGLQTQPLCTKGMQKHEQWVATIGGHKLLHLTNTLLKELSVTKGLEVLGGCDPFKPEQLLSI